MINKIIKDWVGEEKKEIKEDSIFINYLNGYNQALQDLKSRIPQLTERIEKEVEQRLKESWNKSIDEKLPWDLGDVLVAINTLKGGKE